MKNKILIFIGRLLSNLELSSISFMIQEEEDYTFDIFKETILEKDEDIGEKYEFDLKKLDDIVHLNVGGKIFSSKRKTFIRHDSILRYLLSGCFDTSKVEKDGVVFLDRSHLLFQTIFQALKTNLTIKVKDKDTYTLYENELKYYGLSHIINLIEIEKDEKKKIKKKPIVKAPPAPLIYITPPTPLKFTTPLKKPLWPYYNLYYVQSNLLDNLLYYLADFEEFCFGLIIFNLFLLGIAIFIFSSLTLNPYYYQFILIPIYGLLFPFILYCSYTFTIESIHCNFSYSYSSHTFSTASWSLIMYLSMLLELFFIHYQTYKFYTYNIEEFYWWFVFYPLTLVNSGFFGVSIVQFFEFCYANTNNLKAFTEIDNILKHLLTIYLYVLNYDIVTFIDQYGDESILASLLCLIYELTFFYSLVKKNPKSIWIYPIMLLITFHFISHVIYFVNLQSFITFSNLKPLYSCLTIFPLATALGIKENYHLTWN